MKILIEGNADRRMIAYPLIYALQNLGSVLYVSDNDTDLRRGEAEIEIGNVTAHAYALFVFQENVAKNYEYAVFSLNSNDRASEHYDAVLKVINDEEGHAEPDWLRIGYTEPTKGERRVKPNEMLTKYLYDVTTKQRFAPCKDKQVLKEVSFLLSAITGKTLREAQKIALYKGGKRS